MNAIVTGAAGFIASHVVDALLSRGDQVLAIENFLTGAEANLGNAARSGAFWLLDADVAARLLDTSTSEACGDPLEHPQRESYWGNVDPSGVRSCYDEGKRFGEAMVMAYVRAHGIDARIVRIFNTYGSRMRIGDGRVVPNSGLCHISGCGGRRRVYYRDVRAE